MHTPRTALLAALAAAAATLSLAAPAFAAPGDAPRITALPPANIGVGYFDDHSISGDDHLGWGLTGLAGTSDAESVALRFDAALSVSGVEGLQLCGYPSGTGGWMRTFQMLGVACPGTPPAGDPAGWSRYVIANHSSTGAFDRWHVMDLQRFALVPLPASEGGPDDDTPTVWDTGWGTCLNARSAIPDCAGNPAAPALDAGVAAGATKVTQDGAPDAVVIPLRPEVLARLGAGEYQLVALTNPYGALAESGGVRGSVACAALRLEPGAGGLPPTVTPRPLPENCDAPIFLPPAVTGPGGFDPMADAARTSPACEVLVTGHCWTVVPGEGAPNAPARTNATGFPGPTVTQLVEQGGPLHHDEPDPDAPVEPEPDPEPPVDDPGVPLPPDEEPGPQQPQPPVTVPDPPADDDGLVFAPVDLADLLPELFAQAPADGSVAAGAASAPSAVGVAGARARTALRRAFGGGLQRLRVSCALAQGGTARCDVSWRKAGARLSGRVTVRTAGGRWRYRVDVTRRKGGRATQVRRAYRDGGSA
jgi:hypothetical protein